ncbi:hypothetical protein MKW94_012279 [Papaver nudicaule]|uniref:DUF3444 domain-containing protein n=1 Tax=Papaver nudicaule TaxID=74823 RepID=A0AA41VWG9_PAPNU|nr:hypothetical protein [Papaver nudicaule]
MHVTQVKSEKDLESLPPPGFTTKFSSGQRTDGDGQGTYTVAHDNEKCHSGLRRNHEDTESESKLSKNKGNEDEEAENCKNEREDVAEDDDNYEQGTEPIVIEAADPDFYDFHKERSEECFAYDQIWAIFDDLDGMPRFYARINKVYSPFKVDLRWLQFVARNPNEAAWKRSGLPVACGMFIYEKNDTIEDICTFSHKVFWEKGVRNTYKIYPQKGETWALYKNWNMKWCSDPDNHGEFEYEFVVVLSDYNNDSGISVASLVKLKGFVCLFKRAKINGMEFFYSEEENFSFQLCDSCGKEHP